MDNPQYYQPLSHALHPPLVPAGRSPQQQYNSYGSHAQNSAANGTTTGHREEEEEEEEDDEEIVEEELEHNDPDPQQSASTHSSPRAPAAQAQAGSTGKQLPATQDQAQSQATDADSSEKRKPGRPRGSRNRKPRAPVGSSTKAPANSQHPGFYQYPPVPGGAISQNQQFYEFQWRALNLCSEFYNAAEELVKAASPMVIAQCYQMGPATKIDPLAMIADAKRVCDNLLANPSQLVGQTPPAVYSSIPSYPQMAPPAASASPASNTPNPSGSVITNPQSFVMSLGAPAMPPPSHPPPHAQPYYPPMYAAAGSRYPTAPYYSYPAQPAYNYPAPTQPAAATAPSSAAPTTSTTGTISTFNAATGSVAPGGQQGTWSEEETDKLRKLAEQSREMGGPQNKGEIEWDWVVHQWGNSRTRHQILLKATSMGLKESTTRGTKRRRETESGQGDNNDNTAAGTPSTSASQVNTMQTTQSPTGLISTSASTTITPASIAASNASTVLAQSQVSPSTPATIAPARTTTNSSPATASNLPWPMPTVAANTPSPVMASAQTDPRNNSYYRPRPTQTTSYGAAAAANTSTSRPPSSHGNSAATHHYMYRPNGTTSERR
ncbi:hypothetical protein AcV5_008539 [Taiwanofungus camphoratus]|nr:hypothetical protein AcV5_008539 [Antrodia cinnamomea]